MPDQPAIILAIGAACCVAVYFLSSRFSARYFVKRLMRERERYDTAGATLPLGCIWLGDLSGFEIGPGRTGPCVLLTHRCGWADSWAVPEGITMDDSLYLGNTVLHALKHMREDHPESLVGPPLHPETMHRG